MQHIRPTDYAWKLYPMRDVARISLLSITAFCLHNLLLHHHVSACQSTFFGMFFSNSSYCTAISHLLKSLQWSPVVLAAPFLAVARRA